MSKLAALATVTILILIDHGMYGFNLSPKPNLIFREPKLDYGLPKTQSSYFGYTINLRTSRQVIFL